MGVLSSVWRAQARLTKPYNIKKNMERSGAKMSTLPRSTPNSQRATLSEDHHYFQVHSSETRIRSQLPREKKRARVGSPRLERTENGDRIGTKLSLEMAYRSRGPEIKL